MTEVAKQSARLSSRLLCVECGRPPTTVRRPGGAERTVCAGCGIKVQDEHGDSISAWNRMMELRGNTNG